MSPIRRCTALLATAVLTLSPVLTACGASGADTIEPEQALSLIERNDAVTVLDVRTPQEYATGHLPGAVNLSLADDFTGQLEGLDPDGAYLVYCTSGARSAEATSVMLDEGFTDVLDAGGIRELQASGAEVVSGS